MKFRYIFLLLILLFSNSFDIEAQSASDKIKPRWLTSSLPENISPSYIFISASGSGASLEEARQRTLVNLTTKLEHERGIKISSSVKVNSEAQRINGKRTQNTIQTFQMECTEDDKNITLTTRAIDEYWEKSDYGNFICYILYTVSDTNYTGGSYDDDIKLTSSYGAKGFFMSLIPGVGQLYKGSKMKGACIMGGEVLLIGGVIATENLRSSINYRAVELLGGKDSEAYKKLNKKLFSSFYRDIKRTFKVNSYKNLSVKNYDAAMDYIQQWEPNEVLIYAIQGLNSQLVFA